MKKILSRSPRSSQAKPSRFLPTDRQTVHLLAGCRVNWTLILLVKKEKMRQEISGTTECKWTWSLIIVGQQISSSPTSFVNPLPLNENRVEYITGENRIWSLSFLDVSFMEILSLLLSGNVMIRATFTLLTGTFLYCWTELFGVSWYCLFALVHYTCIIYYDELP